MIFIFLWIFIGLFATGAALYMLSHKDFWAEHDWPFVALELLIAILAFARAYYWYQL
jgi:hypothetical protein